MKPEVNTRFIATIYVDAIFWLLLLFAWAQNTAVTAVPILSKFHKPQPRVQVRIFETPSAAVAELLANRWGLDVETISASPLALGCPSRHALAKKRSVGWAELRNLPLIRVGSKTAIRPMIDDALSAARVTLRFAPEPIGR